MTSEKPKATPEKPKMATERTKPSGFLKQSKVHPSDHAQKVYGRSPAGKSKESTSKQTLKTGQFHAEKSEVLNKNYINNKSKLNLYIFSSIFSSPEPLF